MSLLRKRPIGDCNADTGLKRVLGALDLTFLGVGAIIGAGIFVLTGIAAATQAGPAIVLSFVLAGFVCVLAALSYAELAAVVGGSGSAYGYAYVVLGELIAWIIGWALILEYCIGVSAVAIGWSGYFASGMQAIGVPLPTELVTAPHAGGIVNLPAIAIILLLMVLLCIGVTASKWVNAVAVLIKLAVVALFIVVAIGNVKAENWSDFMPFGLSGVVGGAALIFYAYLGFDAVSTAAEEARNPQRDLPIGIVVSLIVCTALYILVAGLLTGIVHYSTLNNASPVAQAMLSLGYTWFAGLIAFGAICGLTTVMLVVYYGGTRILLAMSRDGLLPKALSRIHPRTRTPIPIIVVVGIVLCGVAGFAPITAVVEMANIGTLTAFVAVCIGVVVLRYRRPDLHRPFRTPFMPVLPALGVAGCLWLMVNLKVQTWIYFLIWMAIGLTIYFGYSMRSSLLARQPG
ncbi:MAG TPA: amino acid permease [Steroidobacteraceae bacterium]|nr:amino acid permease [Steroidobacteraceae bacterium]